MTGTSFVGSLRTPTPWHAGKPRVHSVFLKVILWICTCRCVKRKRFVLVFHCHGNGPVCTLHAIHCFESRPPRASMCASALGIDKVSCNKLRRDGWSVFYAESRRTIGFRYYTYHRRSLYDRAFLNDTFVFHVFNTLVDYFLSLGIRSLRLMVSSLGENSASTYVRFPGARAERENTGLSFVHRPSTWVKSSGILVLYSYPLL